MSKLSPNRKNKKSKSVQVILHNDALTIIERVHKKHKILDVVGLLAKNLGKHIEAVFRVTNLLDEATLEELGE